MTPTLSLRHFHRPKAGHTTDEYEDAAATALEAWPLRLAVADGATETAFSGAWARYLTERWTAHGEAEIHPTTLHGWQTEFQRALAPDLQRLPWYAAAKAEQGAFAALLGLLLHADGTWQAWSVGDCNLMQLRDGTLLHGWPFEDPADFTSTPPLLGSRSAASLPPSRTTTGTWVAGDAFLLATDALAAYLLDAPLADVIAWDEAAFHRATEAAYEQGTIRNDDLTLLLLSTA